MSRSSVRLTLVFVAALAALGNAYCYGAIELSNRPCPCADGFICCESTQRCAANPSACTDPGASGADAAPTAEPGATRLDGEVSQLAQDATHVYLAKPSGAIVRTQKLAGSSVEVVEPGDPVNGNSPGALAVDDAHVYWTTLGGMTSGRVLREPKSGGPVEILADDQQRPRRLALSATTVYWGTEGDDAIAGGHANGGALYAVPKAGGQPALLVDESPIGAIAVSGDWVYFARGPWSPRIGALGRVATSGGPVEWLVYNRSVLDLHVAGDTVAWSERVNAGTRIVTMSLATRAIVDHAEGEIGGVALLDGELFVTDEDRPDALVRSLGGGGTSPKVLHQTRYANDANVNTGPIVVDGSHVYWAESWWSYAAGGPHTTLFSQAR